MAALPRLIGAREFANLCEPAGQRHELVGGLLVVEPLPTPDRAGVCRRLKRALELHVRAHDLGGVFGRIGYLLGEQPDTVRGSDVSFVSKSRLEGLDLSRFLPGAPDLAVEVLSSSDWREEIHAKIADYLAAGARLCWVVDCDRRRVSVYRKLLFPTHLSADDVLDGEDVVPGFSIRVEALFED